MRPTLTNDVVWIHEGRGWDAEAREAQPHEIVPALVQIITDLQARITDLEVWHKRVVE